MEIISRFDRLAFSFAENISSELLDAILVFFTTIGNAGLVWIIIGLLFMIKRKTRAVGVCLIVSIALTSVITNFVIKEIVERARPFVADPTINLIIKAPGGYSFPSGHSSASFAAATSIFLYDRKKGLAAFLLAAVIGFSRVYLFVHYATDVVFGMILGIVLAKLTAVLIEKSKDRIFSMLNGN